MTVLWVAQAVTVTNGDNEVIVTSAPGNAITKVETSATFHGVGFSLPYEIERTYNNGTNDVIVLHENWAGSSGSIAAVAVPSGAAVTRAANSLEELKSVYEAIADSVSTTATANSIPQRDANGRMKAAPASASDDVVVKSQIGTAADKNVVSGAGDNTSGSIPRFFDSGGILGLGNTGSLELPPDNDFDALRIMGWWRVDDSSVGPLDLGGADLGIIWHGVRLGGDGVARHFQEWYTRDGHYRYFRFMNGTGTWSDWDNYYHSSNLNLRTFGSVSNGRALIHGFATNTTSARFYIEINEFSVPAGIQVNSGTFRLRTPQGTDIVTGISGGFSVNPISSPRMLILDLTTSGLPGGNADIILCADGTTTAELEYTM